MPRLRDTGRIFLGTSPYVIRMESGSPITIEEDCNYPGRLTGEMSSQSEADQQQQSSQPSQPNAWEKAERKFANKHASEYYDPCQDFADRSLKCMKRNAFDREMCGDYFQAYRDCKKQWLTQKKLT